MTKKDKYYRLMEVFADKTSSGYFTKHEIYGSIQKHYNPTIENKYLLFDVFIRHSQGEGEIIPIYVGDYYRLDYNQVYPHHIFKFLYKNNIGGVMNFTGIIKVGDIEIRWDLDKDLSGQTEETYDQLLSIVNKLEGKNN